MPRKRSSQEIRNVASGAEPGGRFSKEDEERMERMIRNEERLNDVQKKVLSNLKKLSAEEKKRNKEGEEDNKNTDKAITGKEKFEKSVKKLKESVRDSVNPFAMMSRAIDSVSSSIMAGGAAVLRFLNPMNLLSSAINLISGLYENWFRLTNLMVGAMGRFAVATGAVGSQLTEFRRSVETMRDTFSGLYGSIDGITEAGNFLRDTFVSLRMEVNAGFIEEFGQQLVFANRNLGLTANQAAELFRVVEDGGLGASASIEEFGRGMMDFASEIGANAATLSQEFVEARGTVALFGEAGETAFRDAATFANHFGIETSRVLALTQRFNSFSNAANQVNQLNAIFGTTISSMELMMETDPTRRLDMITSSVRSMGHTWQSMGPQMRQALSEAMGLDSDDAMRVFNGESMEEISRERERAAASETERNSRRERAIMSISDLINSTAERLLSFQDMFQQIINDVSESLSPIFGDFYEVVQNIVQGFRNWLGTILSHPEFVSMMEDIASYIREMPDNMDSILPTWEEIRDTAREIWPVIQSIGSMVMSVVEFAADHPEALGIALGALVLSQLLGGFGGLAVLLSPGGAILVGIGLLVAGIVSGSNATSNLADRMERLSNIEAGLRTSAETEDMERSRSSSLVALSELGNPGAGTGPGMFSNFATGAVSAGARLFGNESLAGDVERNAMLSAGRGGDIEGMVRTALGSDASVSEVVRGLAHSAREHPDADAIIRRTFGLSASDDLVSGLTSSIEGIDRGINEDRYTGGDATTSPLESGGAIDTAPITAPTASAAPLASAAGSGDMFMAEVTLDGDRVGSATIRRARRLS